MLAVTLFEDTMLGNNPVMVRNHCSLSGVNMCVTRNVGPHRLTTHRKLHVVWFSSDGQRPSSAGSAGGGK